MFTSIIGAIFVLSFCIFVHELGHFISAIIAEIKVKKFSIGFGKKLLGFKRNDCEYQIALIPFGGYVKMEGESPNERTGKEGEFYSKPISARIFVVLSGVFMNLFFGWLLFFMIFTFGSPSILPIVGGVIKGSPAQKGGIIKGDEIVKIENTHIDEWKDVVKKIAMNPNKTYEFEIKRDGKVIKKNITIEAMDGGMGYIGISPWLAPRIGGFLKGFPGEKSALLKGDLIKEINKKEIFAWEDVVDVIYKNPGVPCSLKVERGNKIFSLTIVPIQKLIGTQTIGMIGITPSFYTTRRYNPIIASCKASSEVYDLIVLNIVGIYKMIKGDISPKMVSGPIGILQIACKTAHEGFVHLLRFTALMSVCLVIVNLLPIPIADGGLVLFFIIEGIRRKPFSETFYERANQVGFGIIILILFFASMNDLTRIFEGFK
ncbi:MAG: RIP metalloprotease RseP [bacterium]